MDAFDSLASRPGAARGMASSRFDGSWLDEDDPPSMVRIRNGLMIGPDNRDITLNVRSDGASCYYTGPDGTCPEGKLSGDGRTIEWDDDDCWHRADAGPPDPAPRQGPGADETRRQAQLERMRIAQQEAPEHGSARQRVAADQEWARARDAPGLDRGLDLDRSRGARERWWGGGIDGEPLRPGPMSRDEDGARRARDREAAQQEARGDFGGAEAQQPPIRRKESLLMEAKARSEAGQDRIRSAMEQRQAQAAPAAPQSDEVARGASPGRPLARAGPASGTAPAGLQAPAGPGPPHEPAQRRGAAADSRVVGDKNMFDPIDTFDSRGSRTGTVRGMAVSSFDGFWLDEDTPPATVRIQNDRMIGPDGKAILLAVSKDGTECSYRGTDDTITRGKLSRDGCTIEWDDEECWTRTDGPADLTPRDERLQAPAGSRTPQPDAPPAARTSRGQGGLGSARTGQPPNRDDTLRSGCLAVIGGMSASVDLNGQVAQLVKFAEDEGRWQVKVPGRPSMLRLKPENLRAVPGDPTGASATEDDYDLDVRPSTERMRWNDADSDGGIVQGPSEAGNYFDIVLEPEQGLENAQRIVDCLEKQGVCTCDCSGSQDLLNQAHEEAERLWERGDFEPPMAGQLTAESLNEAAYWTEQLYRDEHSVVWVNEGSQDARKMRHLVELHKNLAEVCRGLSGMLDAQLGIKYTHFWSTMLSCYTGNNSYNLHVDNPSCAGNHGLSENGLRLSVCYFINPHWDPESGYNGGGLDVYLTDPKEAPASAAAARKAGRRRIAPHADTLVLFLCQRMFHCTIPTEGTDRWYALWLYCYEEESMRAFSEGLRRRDTGFDDLDD